MDSYYNAQPWVDGLCPCTSKIAEPRATDHVAGMTVIKADSGGAYYRGSTFSGIFAVADTSRLPSAKAGKHRVPVFCRWFGHRLKTLKTMPRIEFDMSKCEVIHNYTGDVDSDLSR